ncbi:benzoylformate decarboxylase [Solihabitans fulvus]|uniref:benzoylformate decarboxylase n=1 Tax=Solihabitans fulvus TaxID=1892852 RepID=UPI001CB761DD|nr:benzoylformate decarboxylase [Solihabitans fulvus]
MVAVGKPTVRDVTRDLMRKWGTTTVFGNPGSTELAFLADWPDDFRYVLGLQESTVVAMADAYAQFTGNAAVVNLHSSGGVGHALGSVVTAYKNRSPLVIIAGQQSRSLLVGEPFLGAIEAAEFPKPYVKWSYQPARAADVPAAFARAYHLATQPPYGPTFLSVPADDWDAEAAPVQARPRVRGHAPDPEALREVAAALTASSRPAIVVGASVDGDDAVEDVIALAERTRAAVFAAPMSSRCSFPENHPLFAGFLQPARHRLAEALAEHDCVVVLGAPAFVYHVVTPDGPDLPQLYLINDDEQALAWAPTGTGLQATPKLAIQQLTALLPATDRPAPAPRQTPPPPAPPSPHGQMSGAYVLDAIAKALPDNAIVVEEAPSHRNDFHEYLPITTRGRGFLTIASGVLGYGLPGAVGAALAEPNRPVVAIVGDGSSMYSIQAVWTAVREHTPVTFVILDNAQYGALRSMADSHGAAKVPGMELGGLDFCALASGMGCSSRHVRTPEELHEALGAAIASDQPVLLHVRVDPDYDALY